MISVILPLYGNEGTVALLLDRLHESMGGCPFEIVGVDDCGPDKSGVKLADAAKNKAIPCTIIKNHKNLGQHASVLTGVRRARGNICIVMDADLQDPPELVPWLVDRLTRNGVDVVFGCRRRSGALTLETLASRCFKRIFLWIMGSGLPVDIGLFAALSPRAGNVLSRLSLETPFIVATLLAHNLPAACLPYNRRARPMGKSGYTLSSRIRLASRALKHAMQIRFFN